jgi:O-succinylbenzoic acid--CoA ligase
MNALVSLDTRFVAGAMMIVRALVGGMNLLLREPTSNPLKGLKERVDFLAVVPLQLRAILQESVEELDQLSTVIIGGAPLDEDLVPALEQRRPRFFATYGMTETITHIALRKLNGPDRQRAFYPLPGVRTSLDERGCLVIEALHLGSAPRVTNDLAELTSDGGFQIKGRIDEVINSGGYKVHPSFVEEAAGQILKSLGVYSRFFAAGLPDPLLSQKVCLVIEGSPLPTPVESQLRSRLQDALKKYELPREILYRKSFIETATQKIDKRATMAE